MMSSRSSSGRLAGSGLAGSSSILLSGLAALSLTLSACGASNSEVARGAPRVPLAHIAELPEAERPKALASLPMVIEIRKGDRFPIEPTLDSRLLALHTDGSWTLEATETFYLLLREEGPPIVSEDGIDFDTQRRHSFRVGFGAREGRPAAIELVLGFFARGAER